VLLVDFGIARSAESATLTGAGEVVGTALYIAPEQVSKQVTGPAADIYTLGAVAYHCLAGRPPFLGDSPIVVALNHLNDDPPPLPDDVPGPVRALVARALAKAPADRFPSAAAMADAAKAAAATVDGTAPGGTTAAAAGAAAAGAAAALLAYDPGGAGVGAAAEPDVPAARPYPAGGDTTVLPAAPHPATRRRGALLGGVLGLLTVAAVAAAVAFANPGPWFPAAGTRRPP
jgi:serine/threonine-protein kinase